MVLMMPRERKRADWRERDAEKERLGALMSDKSLNRKRTARGVSKSSSERVHEGSVADEAERRIGTVEDVTPHRGKRARGTSPEYFDNDMEAFAEYLCEILMLGDCSL